MKSFQELFPDFDPSAPGISGTFFGLPHSTEQAGIVIITIPWDVTVSYHEGASNGPEAIKEASLQVDLSLLDIKEAWSAGIAEIPFPQHILEKSKQLRKIVLDKSPGYLLEINEASRQLNQWVFETSKTLLAQDKLVVTLGGDHSTPLGLIQALADAYESFGILQIDAHADLRKSYEGFECSHASIMCNALQLPQVSNLTQVGIRDICEEELQVIENSGGRVRTFFWQDTIGQLFRGKNWEEVCKEIVESLPEKVYLSFDIDGLNPSLCPNTGTPVPGGLELDQALYLIRTLVLSGRTLIGFDLSEVSPGKEGDWDANVGARLLYYLAGWAAVSKGTLQRMS